MWCFIIWVVVIDWVVIWIFKNKIMIVWRNDDMF